MLESLAKTFVEHAEDKTLTLSVYDRNGDLQYSAGAGRLTGEDVKMVRNLLKTDCMAPFTVGLGHANYFCLKNADGILYCKGEVNDEKSSDGNQQSGEKKAINKTSQADVNSHGEKGCNYSFSETQEISSYRGKKSRGKKLDHGFTNKAYDESDMVVKRNIQNTKNESDLITDINDNGNVKNGEPDNGNNRGAEYMTLNNNNMSSNNAENTQTLCLEKKHRRSRKQSIRRRQSMRKQSLLSMSVDEPDIVCEAVVAMSVYGYTVIMHGTNSGRDSWLMIMSKLRDVMCSYCQEE